MSMMIPAWVDGKLTPIDKMQVHVEGLRHKAVSVFVADGPRTLIQRRAAGKYHTPKLWANACCTHPYWEEAPLACAHRRLEEELGIAGLRLRQVAEVSYRADVGGGMVEDEEVTIFAAAARPGLLVRPNPAEVMDWRWITLEALERKIAETPERYTPWLRIYMAEHRDTIFP